MTTPDEPTARKRMPAGCPTPEDCWQNCCHGACLPAPDDTELLRASVELERLKKVEALLVALAAHPRWHLDCEILKYGQPWKWRVWSIKGNQHRSTEIRQHGEGSTPEEAIRNALISTAISAKPSALSKAQGGAA